MNYPKAILSQYRGMMNIFVCVLVIIGLFIYWITVNWLYALLMLEIVEISIKDTNSKSTLYSKF